MAFNFKTNIDPILVPIRPLGGMVRNESTTSIKLGQFYTLSNLYVTDKGLLKRPGYTLYSGGSQIDFNDRPIISIASVWNTNGAQYGSLLTSRYLYAISPYTAPNPVYWTYDTGLITISGTTVTGYSTDWDNVSEYIHPRDYIVIDADGSGDGPEEIEIESIDASDTLTLTATPTGTYTTVEHMEYGDCESINSPTLDGGHYVNAGVWVRTDTEVKEGTYSWVLIKTSVAGPGAATLVSLNDTQLSTDMHGLTAGSKYYISLWMFSDATIGNATFTIYEYYSGGWHEAVAFDNEAQSTWEQKQIEFTLNSAATGIDIQVEIATSEAINTVLHIDDVSLITLDLDYSIRRRFNVDPKYLLDYTVVPNKLIITDHKRPPYFYNGSSFSIYDAALTYIPACIVAFGSRLWMGNIIESGLYYRNRVRWSSPTDLTSFAAADYLDINKTKGSGELKRLMGLNRWLVSYFKDELFIGTPSNLTGLPYSFQPIDTGGIGLIGARALASISNRHIFVGQNGVYTLSSEGFNRIDCPIDSYVIDSCSDPSYIFVISDLSNDRVVLGFPESTSTMTRLWSWNLKTNGWSYEDVSATSLSSPKIELNIGWDDLPGLLSSDNWDTGMVDFSNWDSINTSISSSGVFRTENGYIYLLGPRIEANTASPVTVTIETGDITLDKPDVQKTFLRFSLRLKSRPSAALRFNTTYSTDGGYTWRNAGNLTITSGQIEGKVDFVCTGSTIRIRCTESSIYRYTITEMGIRYRERGIEYVY